MGRIKKCKLSWRPSESDLDVEYRLYWSNAARVDYNSNFIKLGNTTEVDLPDILTAHGLSGESIYIGISTVDKWGNESDVIALSEPYKLSAPAAPVEIELTALDDFKITTPRENAENQDVDTQKQATEKADEETHSNGRRSASKFVTTEGKIVDGFNYTLRKKFEL